MQGTINPADIGTRLVSVLQLQESECFNEPAWSKQNPCNWREEARVVDDEDIVLITNPAESVIDWSNSIKYRSDHLLS